MSTKPPSEMQIPELYAALEAAKADLNMLSGQAREAHRRWAELDQRQTWKADEVRELERELRAANDTTGSGDEH
jgi:hypothetical protein